MSSKFNWSSNVLWSQNPVWIDRGLVLLRAALGIVFLMHGGQKLFAVGTTALAETFASYGIPLPALTAVLVTFVELLGGAAVLAGAVTRVAAGLLTAVMAGAALTVHLPHGFFLPEGYEFTLALGLSALALVMTGAGRYSIDALVARRGGLIASAGTAKAAA